MLSAFFVCYKITQFLLTDIIDNSVVQSKSCGLIKRFSPGGIGLLTHFSIPVTLRVYNSELMVLTASTVENFNRGVAVPCPVTCGYTSKNTLLAPLSGDTTLVASVLSRSSSASIEYFVSIDGPEPDTLAPSSYVTMSFLAGELAVLEVLYELILFGRHQLLSGHAIPVRVASVIWAFARILHFACTGPIGSLLLTDPVHITTFDFDVTSSPKVSAKTVLSS